VYPPASAVYVVGLSYYGNQEIDEYYPIASISGNPVIPTAILTLPAGYNPISVTADVDGQIYAAAVQTSTFQMAIFVFPANASGSPTPIRTILLSAANPPWDIAVDASGLLYVATQSEGSVSPFVNVYASTASGAATPVRTFQLTTARSISGFAVDDAGDVYVSGTFTTSPSVSSGALAVYSPTASGGATPTRLIILPRNVVYAGMAADNAGDIYTQIFPIATPITTAMVEEFGPTANGSNATPINTINLPTQSSTTVSTGFLHLDRVGNLFTSIELETPTQPTYLGIHIAIYGFTPNATGNATPVLSFVPLSLGQIFAVN